MKLYRGKSTVGNVEELFLSFFFFLVQAVRLGLKWVRKLNESTRNRVTFE